MKLAGTIGLIALVILVLGYYLFFIYQPGSFSFNQNNPDIACPLISYGKLRNPITQEVRSFGGCDQAPLGWIYLDSDNSTP